MDLSQDRPILELEFHIEEDGMECGPGILYTSLQVITHVLGKRIK
jgi:hypothetical protein